ncbi:MAG: hypothetical protein PHW52_01170, partial [Candidatus Pacebacteria bacterium]|nr:hypothetical protein [Candidatus Paceibacterota bacterium]
AAFDITVNASSLVDGTITPSIIATDILGNISNAANTPTATKDVVAPINQDTVFASNAPKKGGDSTTVVSAGETGGSIWFAPNGTTSFVIGNTMTTAGGTATSILAPVTEGPYRLFIIDAAGNISNASTAILTVDNTSPTAAIDYSKDGGTTYSSSISVKNGDSLRIRATFNENIVDSPVVQIAVSNGILGASNMVKISDTQYYYVLSVGTENLNPSVSLSTGTDQAGNVVTSTPTSGATFTIDNVTEPPIVSQIGTAGNYINDSNKAAVHVTGTAEAGSLVSVVLIDSALTSTTAVTEQLAAGVAAFDITVNASSLVDGTITPSIIATDILGNISNAANTPTATKDIVAPGATELGNGSSDYTIAQSAVVTLNFSEPINGDSQVLVEDAIVNGSDRVLTFSWNLAEDQLSITGNSSGVTTFNNDVVIISLTDVAGNTANSVLLIDSVLENGQIEPDVNGNAALNNTNHQLVITDPNQAVNVNISNGTTDPTLDLNSFINQGTGILPGINIVANNVQGLTVGMPSDNVVTSNDPNWDGILDAPRLITPPAGMEGVELSFEFGVPGAILQFDKAIRIMFPNQAGKIVKVTNDGINYTEITNICSSDSQLVGDALPAGGDCKIDAGSDLVVWTKHLSGWVIQEIPVTGITVTGAGSATTITTNGGTLQMSAAITPGNATNQTVTWS